MRKLLACIDASSYAASVMDSAAWAAGRLEASIEILHVIQRNDAVAVRHDLSGAVGLGAKSALLEELVSIDEAEAKLARERGRVMLAVAEERLRERGFTDILTTHRHGGIVETVIEREEEADMVVIGKRGASSAFAKEHLGSKVERVVRESIRPVLVASQVFRAPEQVMIAFDGGASSRKALEFVADSPLFRGLGVRVVMAGAGGSSRQKHMDWATGRLAGATVEHIGGGAEEALPKYLEEHRVGMLVMGAYGHSPLRRLIVGSTTTQMMQNCHVPILLFR
ncbi:Universal stress protein family protein [Planctomycetes bacterium Poly30]|uniref:Universal stress protein family protein n=1 Tax=Saltatorellus ferox TaxID=2528018 RepID=A0A518F0Z6_9BACT|nr:Universal stress protein family protein [Planctomycetes bacterium Poly30]